MVTDGNLKIYGGSTDATVDKFTVNSCWNAIRVGEYNDKILYGLQIEDVAIEVNFVKEYDGCDSIFSYGDLIINNADITINETRAAGIYSQYGDLIISNSKIKGSTYISCDERNEAYPIIGINAYSEGTFSITDSVLELYCKSEHATAIEWLNGDFLRNKVTITTDFPTEEASNFTTGIVFKDEVNGDYTYGIFLNNKLVVKDSKLTISANGSNTCGVMIYVPETTTEEGTFGVLDVSGKSQVRINTTKDAVIQVHFWKRDVRSFTTMGS